jgi:integrase/recombinase XerC
VRGGQEEDPLFIAVDVHSFGMRLSERSVTVASLSGQDGEVNPLVGKRMSPHKVRHSSITTFWDASGGGCADGAAVESALPAGYADDR